MIDDAAHLGGSERQEPEGQIAHRPEPASSPSLITGHLVLGHRAVAREVRASRHRCRLASTWRPRRPRPRGRPPRSTEPARSPTLARRAVHCTGRLGTEREEHEAEAEELVAGGVPIGLRGHLGAGVREPNRPHDVGRRPRQEAGGDRSGPVAASRRRRPRNPTTSTTVTGKRPSDKCSNGAEASRVPSAMPQTRWASPLCGRSTAGSGPRSPTRSPTSRRAPAPRPIVEAGARVRDVVHDTGRRRRPATTRGGRARAGGMAVSGKISSTPSVQEGHAQDPGDQRQVVAEHRAHSSTLPKLSSESASTAAAARDRAFGGWSAKSLRRIAIRHSWLTTGVGPEREPEHLAEDPVDPEDHDAQVVVVRVEDVAERLCLEQQPQSSLNR